MKTAWQKRSACSPVHPTNWPFAKQVHNDSLAIYQQAFFTPLFHKNSENTFFYFHNISHPGRLASWCMVSSRFFWRGLASDITAWSRACLHCQQSKIHRHMPAAPASPLPAATFFSSSH
jgi:hypothetical protein